MPKRLPLLIALALALAAAVPNVVLDLPLG